MHLHTKIDAGASWAYAVCMRTTISLDAAVFENARRAAAAAGTTLSALVEAALRDRLAASVVTPAPPFRLITAGGAGLRPDYAWNRLDRQVDDNDERAALVARGKAKP